MNTFSYKNLCF